MSPMRAVVQSRYGALDALGVAEVERPVPGPGEVLVRVRAASVHADVWHVVMGRPRVLRIMGAGLRRPDPAIPGTDLAGVVEARGPGVTELEEGDAVFGEVVGGFQWKHGATYAELATAPARELARLPATLTFEQGAALSTAGLVALRTLQSGGPLRPGARVLVNGAGGAVGSLALQLAKAAGAQVTAVDHGDKLAWLRRLGADAVRDYTRQDVTREDTRYDLVYDVASTLGLAASRRILTRDGRYVLIGHDHYGRRGHAWLGTMPRALVLAARGLVDRHLPRPDLSTDNAALMPILAERAAAGLLAPDIARTYPLQGVAEAIRELVAGRTQGRSVIVPEA